MSKRESLSVTAVCGYRLEVIRWLETLRRHFSGRVILYLSSDYPSGLAKHYGIEIVRVRSPFLWNRYWNRGTLHFYGVPFADWISPPKYMKQWRYIEQACRLADSHLLRTDCWDVVFQANPADYIDYSDDRIYVCDEMYQWRSEIMTGGWISDPDYKAAIMGKQMFNSGTVCGPSESLAAFARILHRRSFNTRTDQAEFNILVHSFPKAFCVKPGLFCILGSSAGQSAAVKDGMFIDTEGGKPWCVIHGEGKMKQRLDEVYPLAPFAEIERKLS